MKKILIIGAGGMLGYDLAKVFLEYKPSLWDKEELDITSEHQVQEKITSLHPEIIINTAAYTNVDGAETDPEQVFSINATAIEYLSQTAAALKAKLVQISTEYVFSGENKEGYNETDQPDPINIYGQSKAQAEKILINSQCEWFIVRTSWLYGQAPQKGKPRGKNFIDTILAKAQQGEEFSVVNDQWGHPTYTNDLAQGIKTMLWENYNPGIYHIVNEGITNWYELAKFALQIKGIDAKIKPSQSTDFKTLAKRPQYAILHNNKLPKLRSWQLAVEDYLNNKTN